MHISCADTSQLGMKQNPRSLIVGDRGLVISYWSWLPTIITIVVAVV
ncbi:MAG: hypothetical protein AAFX80_14850 [Cyanobacteria bacterium J06639_18]